MKTIAVTLNFRIILPALLVLMVFADVKAQLGTQHGIVPARTPEMKDPGNAGHQGGILPMAPSGSIMVNENATYAGYSPAGLVQNLLVQGCLQASNVTYTGLWNNSNPDQRGLGYFNRGASNFPIEEGLILSTGYIADAEGPNDSYSTTREVGTAGDADLTAIAGYTTYDAAILEFDFVPAGNVVEFRYVFASEEFLEWTCSQFNDVFAFLLSGPGITNDPGLSGKNIARLPDGITPVTINNIHAQGRYSPASHNRNWGPNPGCPAQNAGYYIDNGDGTTSNGGNGGGIYMEYDGCTVVLTAFHQVTPCETYHIKLALADVSDRKWDSGIFLEGNSFSSEQITLSQIGNNILNNHNIFEGCLNNSLTITRQTTDLTEDYTVDILISGSAVNGSDILTTGGQPFPAQVTIPAGQASYVIPYYAVSDGLADNGETFIVRVRNSCPCDENIVYVEKVINIFEQLTIASVTAQNVQCNGQNNGVITVNATGGSGSYEYSRNNGTNWQTSNTFTGLSAGNYTVLVRDPESCNDPVSASATIGSPTPLVANAGADVAICSGLNAQLNGSGGVLYSWSPATGLNNAGIANPIASPAVTTTYTLTVTNASGQCSSTDQVVVTVNPSPQVQVNPTETEICRGTETTLVASGADSYVWNPGGVVSSSVSVSPVSNTSYTVTGTALNGCTGTATATVIVMPVPSSVNAGADASLGLCGTFQLQGSASASGSGEPLTYSWSPATGLSNPDIANPVFTPVNSGMFTYTLTVSGTDGCSSWDEMTINVAEGLSVSGIIANNSCQGTQDGSINITIEGGSAPFSFSWTGPNGFSGYDEDLQNIVAGNYQVVITDANDCSLTQSFTVATMNDILAPVPDVASLPALTGECSASVSMAPTATDNCSGTITGTTSDPLTYNAQGTYTITWTFDDGTGNSSHSTQMVIVNDVTAPVVPILADVTGECSASVIAPVAEDNCAGSVTGTTSDPLTYNAQGSYTIHWTFNDGNGNSSTAQQTVIVDDVTAPVAPVLADVTGECSAEVIAPVAEDNCAGSVTGTTSDPLTYNAQGSYTIHWTFSDGNGNSSSSEQLVVVNDVTYPSIICPASVVVNPDAGSNTASNVELGLPQVSDNCQVGNVSNNAPVTFNTGTTDVTWTVTDLKGNTSSCIQTVTVNDAEPPVINCPPAVSVNCTADVPAPFADYMAFINAGGSVSNGNGIDPQSFTMISESINGNSCSQTIIRVYSISDNIGNASQCSHTITVADTVAPVFTFVPANMTRECSGVPAPGTPAAMDNCSSNVTIVYNGQTRTDGNCPNSYTLTRNWTATDECGNSTTASQVITVNDTKAPHITVPAANLTVECDGSGNTADLNAWLSSNGGAIATDNCGEISWSNNFVSLSDNCGLTGSATVIFTASDECGNRKTTSATFTIVDSNAPVFITIPADLTVECDGNGNTAALENWLNNVAASDLCGMVTITNNFQGLSDLCGSTGSALVTWTATDECGNTATTSATFTIADATGPVFTNVPANMTRECSGLPAPGTPTAVDNCSSNVTIVYNGQVRTDGSCPNSYTLTRTWTATDECGNSTTASQVITVKDTKAPHIKVPASNLTVECDGSGNTADLNAWLSSNGGAIATDNCGEISWSNNFVSLSDNCGLTGSATVIFTASDECGNRKTTSATFTIVDSNAPVFTTVPADLTVACDGNGNTAALENWLNNVAASDLCGMVTITNNFQGLSDLCGSTGSALVTWTATDECGNTATTSATFTIADATGPVFTNVPANMTRECSGVPAPGTPAAMDNCSSNVTIVYNGQVRTDGSCPNSYTLTRTWTATDECGNSTTASQVITVKDTKAPHITVPASNLTVECDGSGNTADLNAWLSSNGGAIATDNCGEISWSNNFVSLSDNCGLTGSATVIFTASDECGNRKTTSATFTIVDSNAPVFTTVPADLTVACDGNGNTAALENWLNNVAAADQCGAVIISNNFQGLSDLCGSTGTALVTWTATDACGNTAIASATFTIADTNAPEFTTVPADLTVACDGNGNTADLENWLNNVAAADQCGEVIISNNFQGLNGLCGSTGTALVSWTATDACGNTATASATFTIADTNAPEFTTVPADLTVACDGNGNTADLENWLNNVAAADQCGEVIISNNFQGLSGLCGSTGTALVTWTATDACGNTATASATFTIADTNAPEFTTVPADLTVACDGNGNTADLENWLNNVAAADQCGEVIISNNFQGLSGLCGSTGTALVTWTATDACGNTATASATFTIADTNAPEFTTVPADLTVACDGNGNTADLENWLNNVAAADQCGEVIISNNFQGLSGLCGSTGTALVTWTATDACSNTATASATFTIADSQAPEFTTVPADLTVACDGNGNTADLENWLNNVAAADQCGEVIISNNFQGLSGLCGSTGTALVTWTATDACGNTATASATFTIADTNAPEFTTVPADLTVACDGNGNTADLENWLNNVAAADQCGAVTISNNFQGLSGLCGSTGTALVTWTATDACGNAATTSATFTIYDTMGPVFTFVPEHVTRECSGVPSPGTPVATDICSNSVSIVYQGEVRTDGSCPNEYTLTRTWTATDDCGNSTAATQVITVKDTKAPHIVIPASSLTVECDGTGNMAALNAWLASNGGASATDNCGEVHWTNDFSSLSNGCGLTGSALVTFTAIDECGNRKATSATFTIADTQAPSLSCPQNLTVNTDNGQCGATVQVPVPAASDGCGNVRIVNSINGTSDASGFYLIGSTNITWTAEDECGNISLCVMTVTVSDEELPSITCPANIVANTDPGSNQAFVEIPQPVVFDNCGIAEFTNSFNGTADASGIYPSGTTEVIWMVADVNGNLSQCVMSVMVTDNEPPFISCPRNISVNTDPGSDKATVVVPKPVITDNDVIESVVNSFNGSDDASGIYPVGSTTVTWMATDIHGLSTKCEMVVSVTDAELPIITCPGDIIINAGINCNAFIQISGPVVSDNTGVEKVINSYNNLHDASGVYPAGTTEIQWMVTDKYGNTNGCTMKVTVLAGPEAKDDQAVTESNTPVVIPVLANDTDCNNNIDPNTIEMADNPSYGIVIVDPQQGSVIYTPNAGYYGTDTFTYRICDLDGACDEAKVSLNVKANGIDLPLVLVAGDDTDTTMVNTPHLLSNLENDIIPEGVVAGIQLLNQPSHGTAEVNADMTVTYTPERDFTGTDEFRYVIYDVNREAIADTASVKMVIASDGKKSAIVIYNGITPNNDGKNDKWIIAGIEEYPDNEVLLFNRWGDQIMFFEQYNNSNIVWDGRNRNGKNLPNGTYYYIVKIRSTEEVFTGWVIIHGN